MDRKTEEALKANAAKAALGAGFGVASSFTAAAAAAPVFPHNAVGTLSAQGGRIATDAARHALRNGSTIVGALSAGAGAVGTAAITGTTAAVTSAAASATAAATAAGAVAIAAAPVVLAVAAIGAVGYGLYKIFGED